VRNSDATSFSKEQLATQRYSAIQLLNDSAAFKCSPSLNHRLNCFCTWCSSRISSFLN